MSICFHKWNKLLAYCCVPNHSGYFPRHQWTILFNPRVHFNCPIRIEFNLPFQSKAINPAYDRATTCLQHYLTTHSTSFFSAPFGVWKVFGRGNSWSSSIGTFRWHCPLRAETVNDARDNIDRFGKVVGLWISASKTKVMSFSLAPEHNIIQQ